MVVLINGAFGIGKTTVARLIARRVERAVLFDPELVGFVLQRSLRWAGRRVDDFQDLPRWRRWVVHGVRAARSVRRNVIVPMAFSERSILAEIRDGIARFEPRVLHFCLVAPLEIVHARLRARGDDPAEAKSSWQYRRAAECCAVHGEAAFAEQIPTSGLTAPQVAEHLLARVAAGGGATSPACTRPGITG